MSLIFKEGFSFSGFERDHLFHNLGGKKFQDISAVSGIDSISDGRAAVLADFDNDGDLDVFLTTIQGEGHLLFRNEIGQQNRFLRITLRGGASGRDAFGTSVRVKTSKGTQTRVKTGGEGFLAQHDPRLLFGIGEDERAEWVEIRWPSGLVQRLDSVPGDTSIEVMEGTSGYRTLQEPKAPLPDPLSREHRLWRRLAIGQGEKIPALASLVPAGSSGGEAERIFGDGPAFINLWATWCGPCRSEMRHLEKLSSRFQANKMRLLGISLDQEAGPDEVAAFARKLGITYPLFMIQPEDMARIFEPGEEIVPLSILIDSDGRVSEIFAGWNERNRRRIEALLSKP